MKCLPPGRGDHHLPWMKAGTPLIGAALVAVLAGCAPTGEGEMAARVDAGFADYAGDAGPGCSLGVIRGRLCAHR